MSPSCSAEFRGRRGLLIAMVVDGPICDFDAIELRRTRRDSRPRFDSEMTGWGVVRFAAFARPMIASGLHRTK